MSTIYTFHRELASLATVALGDRILVADQSTGGAAYGREKKDMTLTVVKSAVRGSAATDKLGFYGATPVDQGTMTATATTALSAAPVISASTGAGVFGFASSTAATAYVKRVKQMQLDLETLMIKINSTGLVNITAVA